MLELYEKNIYKNEKPTFNEIQCRDFLVHAGTMIINKNQLKSNFQEEFQGILIKQKLGS